jgi:hypothetical protein
MSRFLQPVWVVNLLSILVLSTVAFAQAESATVTFTLDFPSSEPEHYSIQIRSDGTSHYESSGRLSSDSEAVDNFELSFTVSGEMRQKVFDLAARADYFKKDLDSHRKGLASTGKKTLRFKDAQRSGETTYNYSSNQSVQALTSLMQNLSATLEFGHRLQYERQYQKLALEEELKRMEEMVKDNELSEMGAIQPILQQISDDPSVVNVSRARAQRLLERVAVR